MTTLNELKKRIKESSLDDLVHDLKSKEASAINNGGTEDQVAYIVEQLGEEEAIQEIESALED